ncbi:NAD(P)/FAD-dependent oxidoreductase [Marinomonas fungiae]|uniref:NAD(P)/FAD-dependent oxidoreductase n=1 Tax=Marinomonas fungiae TaxID=1137284 RepID=UPI003A951B7B
MSANVFKRTYDFAVIGGGPAGLAFALLMQRKGHHVVLLDQYLSASNKVGESVPAATSRLLEKLTLPPLEAPLHERISGAESFWAGHFDYQDGLAFLQGCDWRLDRLKFEEMLAQQAQQAGVYFLKAKLQQMRREENCWLLETNQDTLLRADFVIDASGRHSIVSRLQSMVKEKGPPLIALWACIEIDEQTFNTLSSCTLIESQSQGWWYCARLPQRKLMAIFHTSAHQAAKLREQHALWLQALSATELISHRFNPELFTQATVQATNARFEKLERCYGDHWAACGDAAVCFDPISSQGIYNALASAAMLCDALSRSDKEAALSDYQQRIDNVANIYQEKRRVFYQRSYLNYSTDFWYEQYEIDSHIMVNSSDSG